MDRSSLQHPADLFALCVDATWKCSTDLRLDGLQSVNGHALAPAVCALRGRRLDDLASKAVYAAQKDALLACLESRGTIRDLTLSLLNAEGQICNYMLNAAPRKDARDNFSGYVGSLRAWQKVPFAEHRQGEIVELLRQTKAALDKESKLRHEADVLLAALQIMIEPTVLQEKCAKLFDVFAPVMAFDTALVLRRGLRARFTVVATSESELLGLEWAESAVPKAVLSGEARLVEGDDFAKLREQLHDPLGASKVALFVPLCIGTETAVLALFGQHEDHFTTQHLSLMQRVSLIATKAFQEEDQKAALVGSSKLAAMGELLATIVHEINQPITVISMSATNARLLLEDGAESPEIDAKLERIEGQAHRATDIIKALRELSYVDRASSVQEEINLREALEAVETIARIGLKRVDIALKITVNEECPPVQGQSSWLQQVVLNLITNARDAISDRLSEDKSEGTGEIRVDAYPEGTHVVLRVSDNGGGVPEDIQQRIFDPFFTLKQMGKGTGLGLALCQRLIADMGGQITLRNDDRGAVFEISLHPAAPSAIEPQTAAPPRSATG